MYITKNIAPIIGRMAKNIYTRKYIIILCISIILVLLYLNSYRSEGFQDPAPAKPRYLALIFRGESFRKGSQGNRNHGTAHTHSEQKEASQTHMDLVRKLESSGYIVDVFIDTYSTQYDIELQQWYEGKIKKSKFHKNHLESQAKLLEDSVKMMESVNIEYDVVLVVRMDLFLKPRFIAEYDPSTPTVQFVSIMWTKNYKTPKGNPKVNDVIFHFPSRFFDKLPAIYSAGPYNGHSILDSEPLVYGEEYSLLTQNFHDSDSEKDFNPYYRMIGRKENPVWFDVGKQFPKDFI